MCIKNDVQDKRVGEFRRVVFDLDVLDRDDAHAFVLPGNLNLYLRREDEGYLVRRRRFKSQRGVGAEEIMYVKPGKLILDPRPDQGLVKL